MNELENSSGQVASFHIKLKGLNNTNHQMQQYYKHLVERPGQFEILEAKLRDEVMTNQSKKNEILVRLKALHKKIASVTTDITGTKAVKEKLEKYNELLYEYSKHQTKLNSNLRLENSEVLGVDKCLKKRLEQLCAEKRSVTSNNKDLSQRCKYSKDIETAKDQLQRLTVSHSTNIATTWCQANKENVVLEGELKLVVAE